MLLKDDPDIESWECYLTGLSGRMKKCQRCRRIEDCFAENVAENSVEENEFGPEYIPPVILFEPNKRERNVEGLVALVPPVAVTEPFVTGTETLEKCQNRWMLDFRKQFLFFPNHGGANADFTLAPKKQQGWSTKHIKDLQKY